MATVDHLSVSQTRTLPTQTENSLVHSRNLSTTSNVTLFTTTSIHSPTAPLLTTTTPQTVNYDDHIATTRDETTGRPPCEAPLLIHSNTMHEAEKTGYWARNYKRPVTRWKLTKWGVQAVLCTWAIYNTVRYFIAFSEFGDSTNQAVCLALGTSTSVSFLLLCFSFLLTIRGRNGLIYGFTPNYRSYVRTTMEYISSFCLLGPAVVNFALMFIWKDSVDPYFRPDNRCHLDVDLAWSVSNTLCNNKSPGWAIWLTLSALRLVLTLIITVGYHFMSSLYYGSRPQWTVRGFRAQSSKPSTPQLARSSFNLPQRDLDMLQSDTTLCGTSSSEPSPRNQIRLARSHSSSLSQGVVPIEPHTLALSRSSSLSRGISPIEPFALERSITTETENENEPNEFVDRFQYVMSQIAQETDEALGRALLSDSPSPENMNDILTRDLPPSYNEDWDDLNDPRVGHINDNNVFNLPPIFPALGYNEFGLPYPPDQNIRVLNGYIRRMPTIESMGSGEVASSVGASSNLARESILTSSRPPTRNTLLSRNSTDRESPNSEPPSRANSLSARAELLVGLTSVSNNVSEHGEILGRTSPVSRRLSTPLSYVDYTPSDTYSSGTIGSRGASSYHTATGEAFLPQDSPLDKRSYSPLLGQRNLIMSDSDQSP